MQPQLTFLKQINIHKPVFDNKRKLLVSTDCSGIEAPIVALELMNVNFNHIWSSDIDKNVVESINANYDPKYIFTDIMLRNNAQLPKIDLLITGFPCQSFSNLGLRQGFDDEKRRGLVFFACYETIIHSQPTVFILENVKGLLNHDKGETFGTIMEYLSNLKDYNIYYDLLNTLDYGLPQFRERVFIIGIKKSHERRPFKFPKPIELHVGVDDLLEQNVEHTQLTPHKKTILHDLYINKRIDRKSNWVVNLNVSSYKRSSPMKNVSPCLMAQGAIYYLPKYGRNLTPREFLRIQGFPDEFEQVVSDNQMYKQAGNSISVSVLVALLNSIFESVIF